MTYHLPAEKARAAAKVTLLGMILDIALGIAKVVVGAIAGSYALIADGIHSFTDVATDVLVLAITRFSHQEPDEDHPYGHGKFETLGTVVLGSTLIAVAGAMTYDSLHRLFFSSSLTVPTWPALLVAAISIIGKEWIFRYTLAVGKKLRSELLVANAWHSRSDALSSIVVLVGVGGAMAGIGWLDVIAALIVAVLVAQIGWKLAWNSIKELVETAVPEDQTKQMREIVLSVEGVRGAHYIRSRFVGPDIVMDLHLQVDAAISVSEGHHIGVCVARKLRDNFEHLTDITFHIDAENDESLNEQLIKSVELPQREEIVGIIESRWKELLPKDSIQKIMLHYLEGNIHIEVMLNKKTTHLFETLQSELEAEVKDLKWLGSLKIWCSLS